MNSRRNCKQERPERGGHSCVQRCCTRRVAEPKVLVPDVSRVNCGACHPCRQPPHGPQMIRYRTIQSGENEADDEVHDTYENQYTNPRFAGRGVHDVWLNVRVDLRLQMPTHLRAASAWVNARTMTIRTIYSPPSLQPEC